MPVWILKKNQFSLRNISNHIAFNYCTVFCGLAKHKLFCKQFLCCRYQYTQRQTYRKIVFTSTGSEVPVHRGGGWGVYCTKLLFKNSSYHIFVVDKLNWKSTDLTCMNGRLLFLFCKKYASWFFYNVPYIVQCTLYVVYYRVEWCITFSDFCNWTQCCRSSMYIFIKGVSYL